MLQWFEYRLRNYKSFSTASSLYVSQDYVGPPSLKVREHSAIVGMLVPPLHHVVLAFDGLVGGGSHLLCV